MKSATKWNWLIVIATILLVVWPVLSTHFTEEVARWHLAAAANAVEIGDGDFATSLAKATDKRDLSRSRDYWLFRVKQALAEDRHDLPTLLESARSHDPSFASLGIYASRELQLYGDYALAADVLESVLTESARDEPGNLNYLAYLRALSGVDGIDMEQALADIDQALEYYPNEPAFRDTRAWVLFQMGRYTEALEDADFAVKTNDYHRQPNLLQRSLSSLSSLLFDASPEDQQYQPLTRQQAGEVLWAAGALHYHRSQILQALGRDEDAELDMEWLRQHRLPTDQPIH